MALKLGQPLALAIDQAAAAMKPVFSSSWRALTAALSARSVGSNAWGTSTHYRLINTAHPLEMLLAGCCAPARFPRKLCGEV